MLALRWLLCVSAISLVSSDSYEGQQKSEPFLVIHDSQCKDSRSVRRLLEDNGVQESEHAAFEKVLRQNRVLRHQRSLWTRVPPLRRILSDGPDVEDPLPETAKLLETTLSALSLKTRRDVVVTLLDLKVFEEKKSHVSSEGVMAAASMSESPEAKVAHMYLEFLEEDIILSDQLERDRVMSIAAECIPCQAIPPSRPSKMIPLVDQTEPVNATASVRRLSDGTSHIPNEASKNGMWWVTSEGGGTNFLEALKCSRGGTFRPVVAVFDTGCAVHPDIEPALCGPDEPCRGYDYSDYYSQDNNPFDEDLKAPHGTTVSGYIAATPNNNYGIFGLCPHCRISCFKVSTKGRMSGVAIHLSIDHILGAKLVKITNHSYTGGWSDSDLRAHTKMRDAGILNVMGAGNLPCDSDRLANSHEPNACRDSPNWEFITGYRPAPSGFHLENSIVAGAAESTGRRTRFSTWGAQTVHLFTPGESMAGLTNSLRPKQGSGGERLYAGTSFACPILAGLAGYVWSFNPSMTYRDVKRFIVDNTRPEPTLRGYCQTGGFADASRVIEAMGVKCKPEACPAVRTPQEDQTSTYHNQKTITTFRRVNSGAPPPTDVTTTPRAPEEPREPVIPTTTPPRAPEEPRKPVIPTTTPASPTPPVIPTRQPPPEAPRTRPPRGPPRRKFPAPPPGDSDDDEDVTDDHNAYYDSLRRSAPIQSAAIRPDTLFMNVAIGLFVIALIL